MIIKSRELNLGPEPIRFEAGQVLSGDALITRYWPSCDDVVFNFMVDHPTGTLYIGSPFDENTGDPDSVWYRLLSPLEALAYAAVEQDGAS